MSGKQHTSFRSRKDRNAAPTPTPRRRTILASKGRELDALLTKAGHTTYRARAAHLGTSVGVLHRAFQGDPVSAELIAAVRAAFPRTRYSRLFQEVTDDAATQPEAA